AHRRGHDEQRGRRADRSGGLTMATISASAGTASGTAAALKRIAGSQEAVPFLAIVLLLVVVGGINPRYVAERNLESMLLGNAYIAVAAIGMALVIIYRTIVISL